MKKIFLSTLVSIFLFASCREDDKKGEQNHSLIVGTWKTVDYVTISGKDNSVIYSNTIPDDDCIKQSLYTYQDNGICINDYYSKTSEGVCKSIWVEHYDYIYDENTRKLILKIEGITQDTKTVYSLTKDEMQIIVQDFMDENGDGIPDITVRVYKKQ